MVMEGTPDERSNIERCCHTPRVNEQDSGKQAGLNDNGFVGWCAGSSACFLLEPQDSGLPGFETRCKLSQCATSSFTIKCVRH